MPPAKPLNLDPLSAAHFGRNFIRLAVCEVRFPTLFELESERPPTAFSKALRKDYPTHELLKDVNINAGGLAQATAHAFRSRKGRWTIALRASALSLETSQYDSFAELEERLATLLEAARETIDSDFFTRVGVRYINALPFSVSDIREWVNPSLVSPLGEGTYGDVEEHWQSVRGTTAVGGYNFRHGLASNPEGGKKEYILDFDFYREDVLVADTVKTVRELHDLEFSMFVWSLGPKAREHLGPSTAKAER